MLAQLILVVIVALVIIFLAWRKGYRVLACLVCLVMVGSLGWMTNAFALPRPMTPPSTPVTMPAAASITALPRPSQPISTIPRKTAIAEVPVMPPSSAPDNLATSGTAIAQTATLTVTPVQPALPLPLDNSWHLVWDDEFEGTTLDASKWSDAYPSGGNGEAQVYVPDALNMANGILRINAEQRRVSGYSYTSGIIHSHGKWAQQGGYFEIRAKLPEGKGFFPAFWLLPSSGAALPEVDIFEALGHLPHTVYMTNHWQNSHGARASASRWYPEAGDFTQDFHTFALKWQPHLMTWYIDGVEQFHSTQGIPAEPMYLIANLAIGGDWPGYPDASTPFPSSFDIDYIRVYQQALH